MKTLAAAAALGPLVLVGLAAVPAPAYAVQMCHGQVATIVGDGFVVGTEGPDVIVARDARVRAKGGEDIICLRGHEGVADAGAGSDMVDASRTTRSSVELGAGEDTFVGGPGRDRVYGSDSWPLNTDTERDFIATGAGYDQVFSGAAGMSNRDHIGTGRQRDDVTIIGLDSQGTLDVGRGPNQVYFHLDAAVTTTWQFDAQHHLISWDGTATEWRGDIDQFWIRLTPDTPAGTLEFLGSGGAEHVTVESARLVTKLRLRHGDDAARVVAPRNGASYELGAGNDALTLGDLALFGSPEFVHDLQIDLDAHTVDGDGGRGTIAGVEHIGAYAETVRVLGSAGPDSIFGSACDVVADGRAGNDEIRRANFGLGELCLDGGIELTTRLSGGTGRDRLVGADRADDVLLGGRGYDTAIGRAGTDTCRAEVRRSCEST